MPATNIAGAAEPLPEHARRGVAARGEGAVSQQINLYQPIFRKQEKKFSTTAMLQAAGLVLAGIVLIEINLLAHSAFSSCRNDAPSN